MTKALETALAAMLSALELCLECEGLSWEAEFDAELAVRRAKQGRR